MLGHPEAEEHKSALLSVLSSSPSVWYQFKVHCLLTSHLSFKECVGNEFVHILPLMSLFILSVLLTFIVGFKVTKVQQG